MTEKFGVLLLPIWHNRFVLSHHHLVWNVLSNLSLFQLLKCCHFPSCMWCVMLRRHEDSRTGWFSHLQSPKDPIFPSVWVQFTYILPSVWGHNTSDVVPQDPLWVTRVKIACISAHHHVFFQLSAEKKSGVHAQKCWNGWRAIPKKWQSKRWERQEGHQSSPEQN